jgi:hypothetical protein
MSQCTRSDLALLGRLEWILLCSEPCKTRKNRRCTKRRTIEYPFVEAQAAGIVEIVEHGSALAQKVVEPIEDFGSRIDLFLEEHSGASQRTLDAIDTVLAARAGV